MVREILKDSKDSAPSLWHRVFFHLEEIKSYTHNKVGC
jgi:hypothetical protein